jgi:hypothetical protein
LTHISLANLHTYFEHGVQQAWASQQHGMPAIRPVDDVQDSYSPEPLQSSPTSRGQMESQITDRRSFMRFLGLKSSDNVPDSKTIWNFRETLIQEELIEALFFRFNQALDEQSIFAKNGQMVDASIVEVPHQRNSREENEQIKAGQTPESWKQKPNKL